MWTVRPSGVVAGVQLIDRIWGFHSTGSGLKINCRFTECDQNNYKT